VSCPYGVGDYLGYLQGELEAERRRVMEEHLGRCAHCRAELETHALLLEALRRLPEKEPPPGLTEAVLSRIRRSRIRRRSAAISVISSLATLLLVASYLYAVRPLAGRVALTAWRVVGGSLGDLVGKGVALLKGLVDVVHAAGPAVRAVLDALDPLRLAGASGASGWIVVLLPGMAVTAALLYALLHRGAPVAREEVRHVP
jgi:predicted anti-sigma-YlaC factor YlaD